jgi:hypothetical protein
MKFSALFQRPGEEEIVDVWECSKKYQHCGPVCDIYSFAITFYIYRNVLLSMLTTHQIPETAGGGRERERERE